jgi:sugar O-acyltransferase (sialic acid O-acetyltransferase NeuD family)
LNVIPEWESKWNFIGFFDDGIEIGATIQNKKVIGNFDTLNLWDKPLDIVIAIGNPETTKKITANLSNPMIDFPNLIRNNTFWYDKSSFTIGKGNLLNVRVVSCDVCIGDFNCFNGNISIGHDAKIGSFNTIMPSVNISGSTEIGNKNFIGVNATVLQGIKIGNNVRVGAGSVIMRNTKDSSLYIGNPAIKMKF